MEHVRAGNRATEHGSVRATASRKEVYALGIQVLHCHGAAGEGKYGRSSASESGNPHDASRHPHDDEGGATQADRLPEVQMHHVRAGNRAGRQEQLPCSTCITCVRLVLLAPQPQSVDWDFQRVDFRRVDFQRMDFQPKALVAAFDFADWGP